MFTYNSLQIKQHSETKHHKLKTELYKKTSTLDRFFGSTGSSSTSLTCDDKISASELALTYHTVKHNLSYNSMDCTVKLNKIIYADSKTALNIKHWLMRFWDLMHYKLY